MCRGIQRRRQNNFQEGGPTEKRPKNSKKYRKIALLTLFQEEGGNGKQTKK